MIAMGKLFNECHFHALPNTIASEISKLGEVPTALKQLPTSLVCLARKIIDVITGDDSPFYFLGNFRFVRDAQMEEGNPTHPTHTHTQHLQA